MILMDFQPFVLVCLGCYKAKESEVTQLCLTVCDPMNCSPPGSSVHGILQTRILEWFVISFSKYMILHTFKCNIISLLQVPIFENFK